MPRPRKAPALDPALAAILAKANVDVEEEAEYDEPPEAIKARGEGVLYHLKYPLAPRITKVCLWESCGNVFLTDYAYNGYCSNECRVSALKHHFGIAWTPGNRNDREKWEIALPPAIIPMQALRTMKAIVNQAELDLGRPIEIGVEQKPFALRLPYFPQPSASESNYKLPDSAEPSSVSYKQQPSDPADQENQPQSVPSDKTEKKVQSQEQEKSANPLEDLEAFFADL